ncbi:KTSC domain-containing protein [Methylomonas sp. BW4-1]|uniref:KTSC domain-containing protein n=1 Tax=Methylomonas defluvii TaxID=3045149 RepID=A0ABU4UI66_9GAMM|nr:MULTISPECIES: KTSC domain-containing protein [unclassified Methylomonas]MDX8128562.1 KTSC domain-containing protein [Methylomonas sp. OY6]NOV28190.1 KTSC domain-containing protein [Methylomonas sp. ZR1]PKD38360.1 KTSC domain-containing protein [Methylomonas sp. Kb3]QBC28914.1 KTSC domain-containing protein [Methylomonas sp. LW13]QSB00516.1 KTSC domain-containing protein [Methylomonas sp. EFPC1]
MQMQSVKSSTIDVIGYDEQTHKLRVSFKDRQAQDFCHVPEHLFAAFLKARSKNRFYKRHFQDLFPC